MLYTRREVGKLALGSLAVSRLFGTSLLAAGDSRINGVQVGAITYSFRTISDPVEIIKDMAGIGLFEAELMSNHAEALAGAPSGRAGGPGRAGGRRGGGPPADAPGRMAAPGGRAGAGQRGGGRRTLTPEEQAAQDAARAELEKWRAGTSASTWQAVRKQFNDAGIEVRLLCYNMNVNSTSDDEIEYAFAMAKGLGVKAMSTSTQVSMAPRLAPFAEKHQMMVGFHGHDQTSNPDEVSSEATFQKVMAASKYLGANLDIGHYTAANGDPVAFIDKYHDRITNLHIKDRKRDHGPNMPWGEGDTPIKDVLQLLRLTKWDIPANIEFEYAGNPLFEIPKCLQFMKDALA